LKERRLERDNRIEEVIDEMSKYYARVIVKSIEMTRKAVARMIMEMIKKEEKKFDLKDKSQKDVVRAFSKWIKDKIKEDYL